MKSPKAIEQWGLDKKALRIVRRELRIWLKLFKKHAEGREGTIYRADAVKNDYFFFTDCRDLVSKEVESRGQEHNKKIRKRKRSVYAQLIIKNLLGNVKRIITPCSHCGYPEVYVGSIDSGNYDFCPKCGKTVIVTYPAYYSKCADEIKEEVRNKFDEWDKKYKDAEEAIKKYEEERK
jgi:hypothetical protein